MAFASDRWVSLDQQRSSFNERDLVIFQMVEHIQEGDPEGGEIRKRDESIPR